MRKLYVFETSAGVFYIAEHKGRFHPIFREESLGSYATPQQAAADRFTARKPANDEFNTKQKSERT
jgi:hypothetical protein